MDIEKDTWTIIDSYFRDDPDNLVKHQLDSYNDFVGRRIKEIFTSIHHKIQPRTDYNNSNLIYETHVYYGGKTGDGIYISKPTIFKIA